MTQPSFRVVLVDDHKLLSMGLREELARVGIVAWIADLLPRDALLGWIAEVEADLVVLDLGLPYEGGGASLVEPVVAGGKDVMVLTGESDLGLWARCFESGAVAVVSKAEPLDKIVAAVATACEGGAPDVHQRNVVVSGAASQRRASEELLSPFEAMSRREQAVLAGLMDGLAAADLAERDFVSVQTIRTQIKSILQKLGVRSQLEAVAMAHKAGWRVKVD